MSSDSFWYRRRVLVTGAGGFIGGALLSELVRRGARCTALVHAASDVDKIDWTLGIGDAVVRVGDVRDYDFVRAAVSRSEAEVVFHLAAAAVVRSSARDPLTAYGVNVMGTVNVLEAVRTVSPKTSVVVASSDKAYGDHDVLPYQESYALLPKNTYDTSKAAADMVARSYAHNYGVPVTVTRSGNVYGPGDTNYSRIVPNTAIRALHGLRPQLYADVELMEREFLYVGDVVSAYLALGEMPAPGRAFNIGGGDVTRVGDVAKMVCIAAGRPDLDPEVIPREPAFKEIGRQALSAAALFDHCGWKANTPLNVGLQETVAWYARRDGLE